MARIDSLELIIDGQQLGISPELLGKYNQPGPRYTSYPTAPEWDETFGAVELLQAFDQANSKAAPLSLYFHIPFCNSLCLYCGCNVVINKNHEVAIPYLAHLKREIDRVSSQVDPTREVKQLHWGGGTPTYLSSGQIEELFIYIRSRFPIARDAEIGVEIDPRVTTEEQCRVLKALGFNRLSMGIQDFDPLVQKTVHRVQTYEMIESLFDCCRDLGFESINMDLIYGLPHQTMESFGATVDKIIAIDPDRIAVFSYAHVPWMKKQQGSFARFLPEGAEKFRIWSKAIEKLTNAGYRYIGMDHFARPSDELCRAQDDRTLHRNFQGYSTKGDCDLYGMGVSAISGLEDVYAQNWRELPRYYRALDENHLPTMRGIRVSADDKLRRAVINRLLCHCVVVKSEIEREFGVDFDERFAGEIKQLAAFERDGLVMTSVDRIEAVGVGRIFIRNVAMVFDVYAMQKQPRQQTFSKTL
jgi:oxygen-independent coproporphyrinogen-3 oxidase